MENKGFPRILYRLHSSSASVQDRHWALCAFPAGTQHLPHGWLGATVWGQMGQSPKLVLL